jgi:large subunit ribosomal protein L30
MAKLRVTWKKSWIGYAEGQRDTIRSLGLRRLNHVVELQDDPGVRGMIEKVRHLVSVELVEDEAGAERGQGSPEGERS